MIDRHKSLPDGHPVQKTSLQGCLAQQIVQ
jgi:hypothetical protein